MTTQKTDRRTRYTKMVIRQALLDLMKKSPINKISVTEICERADINRGTFYAYYADAYDLLTQIENELFNEVNLAIEKAQAAGTPWEMLGQILEYISQNIDLCQILLGPNGDKEFVHRIVNISHEKNIVQWQKFNPKASREELEQLYVFISNGIVGIVENWIAGAARQDPKDVAQFIIRLIDKCLILDQPG